jgi:hypothetical protein
MITRSEYNEWKKSKVTQELLSSLDANSKALMMAWASKNFVGDTDQKTIVNEAEARGQILAYNTLAKAIVEGKAVAIVKEEDE